ncbi:MAG: diaminopimelate epimerase, partial [Clostridia bacterium]|nr:diaminopimelate epimerase [Clostridia bacterium]
FTKMQGLGNDYLYIYGEVPLNAKELAIKYSDRHFGVGSDGLIFISPSRIADFKMRIFNADGSEAKMCGNGIRCVGKYVYEKGYTDDTVLTIETLSGIKTLKLSVVFGKVKSVSVDMGKTVVEDEITLSAGDKEFKVIPVSVGNPHIVVFVEGAENFPIEKYGKFLEKHPHFKGGVNVEFAEVKDGFIRMRVWERGSGITLACGTGACATVSAAAKYGLVNAGEFVTVKLDGGDLQVKYTDDGVTMTGGAEFIADGETYD